MYKVLVLIDCVTTKMYIYQIKDVMNWIIYLKWIKPKHTPSLVRVPSVKAILF